MSFLDKILGRKPPPSRYTDYLSNPNRSALQSSAENGVIMINGNVTRVAFSNLSDARIFANNVSKMGAEKGIVYESHHSAKDATQIGENSVVNDSSEAAPVPPGRVRLFSVYINLTEESVRDIFPNMNSQGKILVYDWKKDQEFRQAVLGLASGAEKSPR